MPKIVTQGKPKKRVRIPTLNPDNDFEYSIKSLEKRDLDEYELLAWGDDESGREKTLGRLK